MSQYVLTNALLIDGTGAEPRPNHGLVIDDDRIHSVGASGSLTARRSCPGSSTRTPI